MRPGKASARAECIESTRTRVCDVSGVILGQQAGEVEPAAGQVRGSLRRTSLLGAVSAVRTGGRPAGWTGYDKGRPCAMQSRGSGAAGLGNSSPLGPQYLARWPAERRKRVHRGHTHRSGAARARGMDRGSAISHTRGSTCSLPAGHTTPVSQARAGWLALLATALRPHRPCSAGRRPSLTTAHPVLNREDGGAGRGGAFGRYGCARCVVHHRNNVQLERADGACTAGSGGAPAQPHGTAFSRSTQQVSSRQAAGAVTAAATSGSAWVAWQEGTELGTEPAAIPLTVNYVLTDAVPAAGGGTGGNGLHAHALPP